MTAQFYCNDVKNQASAKLTNSFCDTDDAELTSNPMSAAPGDHTTTTQDLTPVRPRCTTLPNRKECDNKLGLSCAKLRSS